MKFLKGIRNRTDAAEKALADSELERDRIEKQWPEVRDHSEWARQTRERNHLTDLFIKTIGGQA